MEAARGEGPAPSDLKLAWWCGDSRLPEAGGVLDQDAGLWGRMQALANVYRTVQKADRAVGREIHKLTPNELKVIRYLRDEELW